MKNKKNLTLIILCLIVVVLGCNDYRDYVVANDSNDIIEIIIYRQYMPEKEYAPRVMSLADFEANKIEWSDSAEKDYKFDFENKQIQVKLNPKQVLSIDTIVANEPESPRGKLQIIGLEITEKNGSIKLNGNQVSKIFTAKHRRWSLLEKSYPDHIFYYK